MQVASDADPLRFLSGQYAPPALLALALEPVEHLVEGMDHAADLVIAGNGQALAGTQQVDHVHPFREALKRLEARRRRNALAATATPGRTTISRASVSSIGALIVTGEAINRIAIKPASQH